MLRRFRPASIRAQVRVWKDTVRLSRNMKRHPDYPWLTFDAVGRLERWLQPGFAGLEWGSGRSTVWFAARVGHLLSVEHDPAWFARVQTLLKQQAISNVDLRLVPINVTSGEHVNEYSEIARELKDASLDFALVDGIARPMCLREAIPKIRPGGLLIFDNAETSFPSPSLAPFAIHEGDFPRCACLYESIPILADWRLERTSDGLSDTWLWFAPDR